MTRRTLLFLLAFASLAVGCAGRSVPARGRAQGGAVREVLLFPLNVVVPMPTGLEPGAPRVEEAVRSYLESQGRRVQTLPPRDAQAAWLAAAEALKAEVGDAQMSFEGAARLLARELARERRFDALVLPWLALRPAKVHGRVVSWDGVSRTLRVANPSGRSLGFLGDFQAQAAAPSLQVVVFSAEGETIFAGVGGLDLIHSLAIQGDPPKVDAVPLPRSEVFSDLSSLQEGIGIAFDPFLPRAAAREAGSP